jgi:hypothetical protein
MRESVTTFVRKQPLKRHVHEVEAGLVLYNQATTSPLRLRNANSFDPSGTSSKTRLLPCRSKKKRLLHLYPLDRCLNQQSPQRNHLGRFLIPEPTAEKTAQIGSSLPTLLLYNLDLFLTDLRTTPRLLKSTPKTGAGQRRRRKPALAVGLPSPFSSAKWNVSVNANENGKIIRKTQRKPPRPVSGLMSKRRQAKARGMYTSMDIWAATARIAGAQGWEFQDPDDRLSDRDLLHRCPYLIQIGVALLVDIRFVHAETSFLYPLILFFSFPF